MLAASLERISIGLLLIRKYNIFLLGKLARLVMGTIFLVSHKFMETRDYTYVLFLIRMRAFVFSELNSRARKGKTF